MQPHTLELHWLRGNNAIFYRVGKRPSAAPLTETEASENATICQNRHLQRHCTHDIRGLACDVQWVFWQFFAICIACIYRSLINEQFLIWYGSAQCCANGIFMPMDSLTMLTCAVACQRPANSACCMCRTRYLSCRLYCSDGRTWLHKSNVRGSHTHVHEGSVGLVLGVETTCIFNPPSGPNLVEKSISAIFSNIYRLPHANEWFAIFIKCASAELLYLLRWLRAMVREWTFCPVQAGSGLCGA